MNLKIDNLCSTLKKTHTYEVLRHSGNYFLADISIKAIGFISIPFFARLLTEEEYGTMSVFYAYIPIFIAFLSLNSYMAVSRYYFERKEDFSEFLGSTFLFFGVAIGITVPVYVLLGQKIFPIMNLPRPLPIFLVIVSILNILYSIYLQTLYPKRESKRIAFIIISYSYTALSIAIIITLFLVENRYMGRVIASVVTGLIFAFYFIYKMFPEINLSFNKTHFRYIIAYSIPLIPYSLSEQILNQFDRIMINSMIGSKPAAFYSIGYNIGMLLLLAIGAIQTSISPDFYRYMDEKRYDKIDKLIERMFSYILLFAFVLILFGENVLYLLAGSKFYEGSLVIPPVVAGYIFYGLFSYYASFISYYKKTVYFAVSTLIAGTINVLLNIIFIPLYGYLAAAYTTLFSYFVLFFILWLIEKYLIKIKITSLKIFIKKISIFYLILTGYYAASGFFLEGFSFQIFLKIFFLFILFVCIFLDQIKIIIKI